MKNTIFAIIVMMMIPTGIFTNGGPINERSTLKVGDISLKKISQTQLLQENLYIKIIENKVSVKVFYNIDNRGRSRKVHYGFPIDFASRGNGDDKDITNFKLVVNGRNIKTTKTIKKVSRKYAEKISKRDTKNGTMGMSGMMARAWYSGNILLKKGRNYISVSYTSSTVYSDSSTSKSPKVYYSDRFFYYDFSPASGWGNGRAKKLTVSIDTTMIKSKAEKLYVTGLRGIRKVRNGFRSISYNHQMNNQLEITYSLDSYLTTRDFKKKIIKIKPSAIKTSSFLKSEDRNYKDKYNGKKAFDGNLNTSWVEGAKGLGKGQWLEVYFKKPITFYTIAIANGYAKNRSLYNMNAKIKKLKVEITASESHTIIMTFDNIAYPQVSKKTNLFAYLQLSYRGSNVSDVRKIRFTILDVYPGTKFKDTSISEIFFIESTPGY